MDSYSANALSGPSDHLQAHVVHFDSSEEHHVPLLGGPPETVTMRAGLVTLKAGESVGEHTTGENEEAVVVLEGLGQLRLDGRPPLGIAAGSLAYCPPETRHSVVNTGSDPLRYVYVVSRALPNHPQS